jgi:hypothetical protein
MMVLAMMMLAMLMMMLALAMLVLVLALGHWAMGPVQLAHRRRPQPSELLRAAAWLLGCCRRPQRLMTAPGLPPDPRPPPPTPCPPRWSSRRWCA